MIGASCSSGHGNDRRTSQATSAASAATSPTSTARAAALATKVGLDHAFVALDGAGRAFGDLLAVVEDEDGLAEPHHDLHVVLDQQHGLALIAQAPDGVEQVVEQRAVHAGRGL